MILASDHVFWHLWRIIGGHSLRYPALPLPVIAANWKIKPVSILKRPVVFWNIVNWPLFKRINSDKQSRTTKKKTFLAHNRPPAFKSPHSSSAASSQHTDGNSCLCGYFSVPETFEKCLKLISLTVSCTVFISGCVSAHRHVYWHTCDLLAWSPFPDWLKCFEIQLVYFNAIVESFAFKHSHFRLSSEFNHNMDII